MCWVVGKVFQNVSDLIVRLFQIALANLRLVVVDEALLFGHLHQRKGHLFENIEDIYYK